MVSRRCALCARRATALSLLLYSLFFRTRPAERKLFPNPGSLTPRSFQGYHIGSYTFMRYNFHWFVNSTFDVRCCRNRRVDRFFQVLAGYSDTARTSILVLLLLFGLWVPPALCLRTRGPNVHTIFDVLPVGYCIDFIIDPDNWFYCTFCW